MGQRCAMKASAEERICFYSAFAERVDCARERIAELLVHDLDREQLISLADDCETGGLLYACLSGLGSADAWLLERLRPRFAADFAKTEIMRKIAGDILSLLVKSGFDCMPLKGSDPRIAGGSRSTLNPMTDIDILVKNDQRRAVVDCLVEYGCRFQGVYSESHANLYFDSGGADPCFIEIHWDLINRGNPLHSRLFKASIEAVWERAISGDTFLMSYEDLVSYSIAHAVKEYFHKPKWLADIAWLIRDESAIRPVEMASVISEWSAGAALGMAIAALGQFFPDADYGYMYGAGAVRSGLLSEYTAGQLASYSRLRQLRPLVFFASATGVTAKVSLMKGFLSKAFILVDDG